MRPFRSIASCMPEKELTIVGCWHLVVSDVSSGRQKEHELLLQRLPPRACFVCTHLESPEVCDGREVESVVPIEGHQVRRPQQRVSPIREGPISYKVYSLEDGQVILSRTLVCKNEEEGDGREGRQHSSSFVGTKIMYFEVCCTVDLSYAKGAPRLFCAILDRLLQTRVG